VFFGAMYLGEAQSFWKGLLITLFNFDEGVQTFSTGDIIAYTEQTLTFSISVNHTGYGEVGGLAQSSSALGIA